MQNNQVDQDYNNGSDVEEIDITTKPSEITTPNIANAIKVLNPVFLKSKQKLQQLHKKRLKNQSAPTYDFPPQKQNSALLNVNTPLNDIYKNCPINSDNMVLPHGKYFTIWQ